MGQFCYLRLSLGIETVSCRLLLRIAWEQALLFRRAKQAARERVSNRQSRELPRLFSRATRASTFHDIPKWRPCSEAMLQMARMDMD